MRSSDPLELMVLEPGPDLAFDGGLSANELHATPGTPVLVAATVRNRGRTPVSALQVRFFAGTPESGTLLGVVTMSGPLGFNEARPAEFLVVRTSGRQEITAQIVAPDVDPSNNRASIELGQIPPVQQVTVGLSALHPDALTVRWLPPAAAEIRGYRVLRAAAPEGPYELVGESAAPIFHDRLAPRCMTNYYVVRTYGLDCVMSNDSQPVAGAIRMTADLDGDNAVGLSDLAALLSNFGTPSGAIQEQGDLDGDGDVELSDLAVLLANFGATCL
jgi:hypothetical protein